MRTHPIRLSDRRCEYGAIAEDNAPACRKCRNRAQWRRRHGPQCRARLCETPFHLGELVGAGVGMCVRQPQDRTRTIQAGRR